MGEVKPEVSVVIPAFKEEKYIEKLLKSLAEIGPNVEIIVVVSDGGDRTAEISRHYSERVYVIKKYGISAARNYGVKKSRGNIILFLDSDVQLPGHAIDTLIRTFRDEKVVGATCNIMPLTRGVIERSFFIFYNLLLRLSSYFKPHSRGEFLAVRRSAFYKVKGFDESLPCLEDHDLVLRLSKFGSFCFVNKLTVYESMRRFKKLGFMEVLASWILNYSYYVFRGRTISKSWQPVR